MANSSTGCRTSDSKIFECQNECCIAYKLLTQCYMKYLENKNKEAKDLLDEIFQADAQIRCVKNSFKEVKVGSNSLYQCSICKRTVNYMLQAICNCFYCLDCYREQIRNVLRGHPTLEVANYQENESSCSNGSKIKCLESSCNKSQLCLNELKKHIRNHLPMLCPMCDHFIAENFDDLKRHLHHKIGTCEETPNECFCKIYEKVLNENERLKKENEWLKQQIKEKNSLNKC